MSTNDGGPFHPCEVSWNNGVLTGGIQTGGRSGIHTGASLRDHFAGLAMQGLLANEDARLRTSTECARIAYEHADAALRAREASQ